MILVASSTSTSSSIHKTSTIMEKEAKDQHHHGMLHELTAHSAALPRPSGSGWRDCSSSVRKKKRAVSDDGILTFWRTHPSLSSTTSKHQIFRNKQGRIQPSAGWYWWATCYHGKYEKTSGVEWRRTLIRGRNRPRQSFSLFSFLSLMRCYPLGYCLPFDQVHYSYLQLLYVRSGMLLAEKGIQYTDVFPRLFQSHRGERTSC